jgi:hypothetical protein
MTGDSPQAIEEMAIGDNMPTTIYRPPATDYRLSTTNHL